MSECWELIKAGFFLAAGAMGFVLCVVAVLVAAILGVAKSGRNLDLAEEPNAKYKVNIPEEG